MLSRRSKLTTMQHFPASASSSEALHTFFFPPAQRISSKNRTSLFAMFSSSRSTPFLHHGSSQSSSVSPQVTVPAKRKRGSMTSSPVLSRNGLRSCAYQPLQPSIDLTYSKLFSHYTGTVAAQENHNATTRPYTRSSSGSFSCSMPPTPTGTDQIKQPYTSDANIATMHSQIATSSFIGADGIPYNERHQSFDCAISQPCEDPSCSPEEVILCHSRCSSEPCQNETCPEDSRVPCDDDLHLVEACYDPDCEIPPCDEEHIEHSASFRSGAMVAHPTTYDQPCVHMHDGGVCHCVNPMHTYRQPPPDAVEQFSKNLSFGHIGTDQPYDSLLTAGWMHELNGARASASNGMQMQPPYVQSTLPNDSVYSGGFKYDSSSAHTDMHGHASQYPANIGFPDPSSAYSTENSQPHQHGEFSTRNGYGSIPAQPAMQGHASQCSTDTVDPSAGGYASPYPSSIATSNSSPSYPAQPSHPHLQKTGYRIGSTEPSTTTAPAPVLSPSPEVLEYYEALRNPQTTPASGPWICRCFTGKQNALGQKMVCGESHPSAEALDEHMKVAHLPRGRHSNGQHFCEWAGCNKTFNARPKLARHMLMHSGYTPFQCSYCDTRMKTKDAMVKHERTHTGEKPFDCDVCHKKFATSTELSTHKTVHTGKRPHTCMVCQQTFADSSNLSKHKKSHLSPSFHCDDCPAQTTRWDQIKRHCESLGHMKDIFPPRTEKFAPRHKLAQASYKKRMHDKYVEYFGVPPILELFAQGANRQASEGVKDVTCVDLQR